MNGLFFLLFLVSAALIAVRDPSAFLPALLDGAKDAIALCLTLAAIYAVWLGFLRIAQDAGLLRGMARLMKKPIRKLFHAEKEEAIEQIAVNLSANFLGMGGAATPAGIRAMELLGQEQRSQYARAMLFVVNCSGFQLLPTTVLALRAQLSAASPYEIVFPIFLSTLCALLIGIALVKLVYGRKCA